MYCIMTTQHLDTGTVLVYQQGQLASPVLARPVFKVKINFHFYKKQIIKSASVTF